MSRWAPAGALVSVLLGACGLIPAPDAGIAIDDLDTNPRQIETDGPAARPDGPAIEILRGRVADDLLSVVVQRAVDGVCMGVFRGSHGGSACGPLPGAGVAGAAPFGPILSGSLGDDDPVAETAGIVGRDVASVVIDVGDGRRARATMVSLAPADVDAQAFFIYLPEPTRGSVIALAADGSELGRLVIMLPPGP